MRPFNRFASSAALVLAALVGCNIHSGSGLDPNELVEGGSGNNSGSGGGSGSGSGAGSGGSSGGNEPGTDAGLNSSGGSGGSSGGGGPNCAAMAPVACVGCCGGQYPGGKEYESGLQACLCGGSVCASACAGDVCAGEAFSSASAACQQCATTTTCYPQLEQNCMSDPSCQPFMACTGGCPNDGTGSGSGGGSGSGSGGSSGGGSGGGPVDAGPSCPSNPSNCVECCAGQDPAGYQIFLGDLAQCLCTGTAACAGPCKSELCGPSMTYSPQDACGACVSQNTKQGSTCYNQVDNECASNAACVPFGSCYLGCPAGSQ